MIFRGQPGWPEPSSPSAVSRDCSGKQPKAQPDRPQELELHVCCPLWPGCQGRWPHSWNNSQHLGALGTVTKVHLTQLMPAFADNLVILQELTTNNGVVKGGLLFLKVQLPKDLERNPATASENRGNSLSLIVGLFPRLPFPCDHTVQWTFWVCKTVVILLCLHESWLLLFSHLFASFFTII